MILVLDPLLILFLGLAAGSTYMYFKKEQVSPKITIDKGYHTRPRE